MSLAPAFVPGGQGAAVESRPTDPDYARAEVFADRGIIIVNGPFPGTDETIVGRLIVERSDGATFAFNVANPEGDVQ